MILRQFTGILGANAVTPLCALISGPILAYGLGPAGRGEYATLTVPIVIVGIAGTLGFQDGLTYAIARAGWTVEYVRRNLQRLGLVLSTASVSMLILVSLLITQDHGDLRVPLLFFSATAPIQVYTGLYAGILVGKERYGSVNLSKITVAISRLLILAALFASGQLTPVLAAAAHMGAGAVGLAVLGRATNRISDGQRLRAQNSFDLTKYSLAAAPAVIANLAALRMDQVFALPLIGSEQLGLYAAAVGLAEATTIVAATCRTMILGGNGSIDATRRQRNLTSMAILLTLLGAVVGILVAPVLVPFLLGPEFQPAVIPCILIILGNTALALCILASGWLLRIGVPKWQSAGFAIGCVANILALIIFRDLGASGAAIAAGINYLAGLAIMCTGLYRNRDRLIPASDEDSRKSDVTT
ncbi:MAG: hypothetical protein EON54_01190 [Alcaligenaceae bacterium]|nr:MAG: hypothetical protein EON54_01190 [Alcaligenaceae bacterium]